MKDIIFQANLNWTGEEGQLTANDTTISISEPADMGGEGVGMSPEDLLVSAVATCYIGTFFKLLKKRRLPVDHVSVQAKGEVVNFPEQMEFKRITVYPTVHKGDPSKQEEYDKWASKARDKCFIGKTIHGNVSYEVGPIQIITDSNPEK